MSRRVEAMKRLLDKGADEIESRKSGEVRIVWRGRSHLTLHIGGVIAAEPAPGPSDELEHDQVEAAGSELEHKGDDVGQGEATP